MGRAASFATSPKSHQFFQRDSTPGRDSPINYVYLPALWQLKRVTPSSEQTKICAEGKFKPLPGDGLCQVCPRNSRSSYTPLAEYQRRERHYARPSEVLTVTGVSFEASRAAGDVSDPRPSQAQLADAMSTDPVGPSRDLTSATASASTSEQTVELLLPRSVGPVACACLPGFYRNPRVDLETDACTGVHFETTCDSYYPTYVTDYWAPFWT
ncbi:unnamed protein product [Protopolystoma xenopodis]|uniref:Uncharacterized protein n=1 Tax=Protopolystoma xenopodis TaxID=117903 RepID=A0A448WM15_9PLAT|nr:unnamed protein product [Protopolystoma xenopodis]